MYIPFDSVVSFHKLVAYTALFFTGMECIYEIFNIITTCNMILKLQLID